jgi:hypothetical protein
MKYIVLSSLALFVLFWIAYIVDKFIPPRRSTRITR